MAGSKRHEARGGCVGGAAYDKIEDLVISPRTDRGNRAMTVCNMSAIVGVERVQVLTWVVLAGLRTLDNSGLVPSGSPWCPWIRNLFGFDCKPTSKAERKFPLAYGLLVYTNAIQVLFMLSAFYRLQNEYCIAVSGSASKDFKFLMKVVDECFDNVYVMERPPVKWGSFEILNSTFACLEVLSHSDRPWRYYQYLSGFDVPLKTNREMIEIFKMWNNTVNARYMRYEKHRLNQKREEDSPLPIIKASVSAALPRSAVDKIVKSKETRKLLKFLQGTTIPDESFWGTLTGNTDKFPMPGGINAEKLLEYQEEHNRTRQHMVKKFMKISPRMSNYLSRYQLWRRRNDTCRGKYVHGSCVYGLKDLADLMKQPHLVAHKMYIDFQPAALFCALKTIRIRERDRFTLNVKPYSEIPHVQLSAGLEYPREMRNQSMIPVDLGGRYQNCCETQNSQSREMIPPVQHWFIIGGINLSSIVAPGLRIAKKC
ncbi:hypothetical protein RB195_004165 [Necator americanus]|uniref:Core-2/I-Branching enzyme n=1 Tax=Necator americanus TaxID=51031 RepID=A0ABR1BGX7_NECAM